MTNEQIQFVQTLTPLVRQYALSYGHNPNNVVAMVAQACNESNWGKSQLSAQYHNYWGMKCGSSWTGPAVNMATKEEYTPGTLTNITAYFRVYANMEEGVKGYFDFINTSRYSNLKNTTSPQQYLETIKADGYATSSSYVTNIMKIVNQIDYLVNDTEQPAQPEVPTSDLTAIALQVIGGYWGNGIERKNALEAAGYNYHDVQTRVNALLVSTSKKEESAESEVMNSMNLILYKNFTKRINSTKQPTAAHAQTAITANLKETTSIENPTFIIDGVDLDVNYIYWQEVNRYYFVTDIRLQNRNIYEVSCAVDVLASYKTDIGNYTAYIERAATLYNSMINDNALSVTQNVIDVSSAETDVTFQSGATLSTIGCYMLRIVGSQGTVRSYARTYLSDFEDILAPNVATTDLEQDLKALGSLVFDASSYIVSAHWIPFAYTDLPSGDEQEIYLKYYPTGVMASVVGGFRKAVLTINKPTAYYSDFREYNPNISEYVLYLPGVGNINIGADIISTTLTCDVLLDMRDGSVVYGLKSDGDLIATYNGNLYVQIPLGFTNSDVKSVVGATMSTLGAIASGNVPLAAASAVDAVSNVVSPTPSIVGSYNSSVNIQMQHKVVLTRKSHGTGEFTTTVNGRPLCSNRKINTLSGFIKCGAAAIDLHGLESEKTAINNFMNSGFYYE